MFFVYVLCFFDIKLPEDYLKKIETCGRISALCVNVHGLILAHFVVLSIQFKIF